MSKQRAPFLPVSSDIDDDKLERLARDKGVGAFVKPTSNANRAGEGAQEPAVAATPKQKAETPAADTGATPRSRMKTVNLELPDYVWTELKIRSAHRQTSVRHIIMTALKGDGISIADVDMVEDGRRLRGANV
jgi:hypothetical protein